MNCRSEECLIAAKLICQLTLTPSRPRILVFDCSGPCGLFGMSAHRFRTGATLLLSAVVMAGTVVSPVVRHSHSGGERAHDHVAASTVHEHRHGQEHDGREHHGHRHAHRHSHDASLNGASPHVHLNFLGWALFLPAPLSDPLDAHGNSTAEPQPRLVRLVDHDQIHSRDSSPALGMSGMPSILVSYESVAPVRRLWDPQILSSAQPLCDSARHERSGVQRT